MPGSLGIEAVIQAFKAGVHSIEKVRNPSHAGAGKRFSMEIPRPGAANPPANDRRCPYPRSADYQWQKCVHRQRQSLGR